MDTNDINDLLSISQADAQDIFYLLGDGWELDEIAAHLGVSVEVLGAVINLAGLGSDDDSHTKDLEL